MLRRRNLKENFSDFLFFPGFGAGLEVLGPKLSNVTASLSPEQTVSILTRGGGHVEILKLGKYKLTFLEPNFYTENKIYRILYLDTYYVSNVRGV